MSGALAALLARLLLVGDLPGLERIGEQLQRGLSETGTVAELEVHGDLSALSRPAGPGDHLFLAPARPPVSGSLSAAPAAAGQGALWLVQSWPEGPLSASAPAQVAADYPRWQAAAREIGAGLVPVGAALAQMIAAEGSPALSHNGVPDDRAQYLAALTLARALPRAEILQFPDRLVRRWIRRDSVVTPDFAGKARALAQALAPEAPLAPLPRAEAPPVQAAPVPLSAEPAAGLPAHLAGVQVPGIGFGLAPLSDWSVQLPFLDQMKSARPWAGHRPGQWGAVSFQTLLAEGYLSESGWPLRLPPGVSALAALVLTDLPESTGGVAGRYLVTWEGEGDLRLHGRARNVSPEAGGLGFDFQPGQGAVEIALHAINPANPVRNIQVVRRDRRAAFDSGARFNPDLLARLRGSEMIRFMDWMQANSTEIATPAERPKPDDFSYAWRGAPPEVMVALANELKADAWLTLPWRATADLHRDYARVVHRDLHPDLRAWIEYSNEIWNMGFPQAHGLEQEARARWGQEWKWMQLYGLRAREMVEAWDAVFIDAPARLVRVLSSQTGWLGLESDVLDPALVRAEGREGPAGHFDVWAVTGYLAAGVGSPEHSEMLHGWLRQSRAAATRAGQAAGLTGAALEDYIRAHRFDAAIPLAIEELRDGRHSGNDDGALSGLFGKFLPWHEDVAKRHGMRLVMYEGGTHAVAHGPDATDEEVTAFLTRLNYHPLMGALYRDLIDRWQALSAAPFMAYVDVMQATRYGSWGALRHLGDDNPRWRALVQGTDGAP